MPRYVYLLLLLGCTVQLHANVAHGASQDEQGIDPFDLARQLRAEICATNKSQRNEFYKAKRDEESKDRQFPGVGKPITDLQADYFDTKLAGLVAIDITVTD